MSMKSFVIGSTLAMAAVGAAAATPRPPIACRMGALDKAQRVRQAELLERFRQRVMVPRVLADGLAFDLPADPALFREVAEWITLERLCCPFLDFSLEWRFDGSVSVTLTGQPGVKEFLEQEVLGQATP